MITFTGSHVLAWRIPIDRVSNDRNIIGSYQEVIAYIKGLGKPEACYPFKDGTKQYARVDGMIIEAEITWPGSSAEELFNLIESDPDTIKLPLAEPCMIPSLNLLYMLKMSHRYLKNSPHFLKTMRDIQLMRDAGAFIQDNHQEFYQRRQKATYTYNHPKLNTSKDGFFKGDQVPYTYDHDSIHEAVKQGDRPAYTNFKRENSEVWCDKQLFFSTSEENRLNAVLEEAYVLAAERSQIPFPDMPRKKSFDIALEKVCTSITSGWFREYAWENYDAVQALYSDTYMDRVREGIASGSIKPLH